MTRHRRRIPWLVAAAAAFLVSGTVAGAPPASAHEHPTPTERAAPGVVYVEARAQVEVALVEHLQSDPEGIHIRIVQSTSTPVLGTASGFVVEQTGTIVTTGRLTGSDLDRARVYGVNEAFAKQYGDQAPMSDDLFEEQRIGDAGNRIQQRLDACYPPHRTNDAGGCVVTVSPTYTVYPNVSSQQEHGEMEAALLPSSTPDVAVLRVRGASGMPTVPLAESTAGTSALANLGFTGIPDGVEPPLAINAHLAEPGGTVLKTEQLDDKETKANTDLAAALPEGLLGGPLVGEQGQVVGFLVPEADSGPPPAAPGRLVDAGAIREVLAAEGITPKQGPVDTSFEAAMHAFKNGGYAASIPNLERTLELFPGHAMAAANLAVAQQNVAAGTPGPADAGEVPGSTTSSADGGTSWTLWLLLIAALLLLAGIAAFLLRRRRRTAPPGGSTPPGGSPRPPGGPKPPAPATGSRPVRDAPVLSGSGRSGGSASVAGAGPATVADPGARPGRATAATAAAAPSSARQATGAAPRSEFCTSCGAHLAADHLYCGRCGAAAR